MSIYKNKQHPGNRSTQQNRALHLDFRLISDNLNRAGFGLQAVMNVKKQDVPWTPLLVKEALWKPLQIALFDKMSTTELNKSEISEIHQKLITSLNKSLGLNAIEFPNDAT